MTPRSMTRCLPSRFLHPSAISARSVRDARTRNVLRRYAKSACRRTSAGSHSCTDRSRFGRTYPRRSRTSNYGGNREGQERDAGSGAVSAPAFSSGAGSVLNRFQSSTSSTPPFQFDYALGCTRLQKRAAPGLRVSRQFDSAASLPLALGCCRYGHHSKPCSEQDYRHRFRNFDGRFIRCCRGCSIDAGFYRGLRRLGHEGGCKPNHCGNCGYS